MALEKAVPVVGWTGDRNGELAKAGDPADWRKPEFIAAPEAPERCPECGDLDCPDVEGDDL